MSEPEDGEQWESMLSSGSDVAIALINLKQPWLLACDRVPQNIA